MADTVPCELWTLVFRHVPVRQRVSLRAVAPLWRAALDDPALWRGVRDDTLLAGCCRAGCLGTAQWLARMTASTYSSGIFGRGLSERRFRHGPLAGRQL